MSDDAETKARDLGWSPKEEFRGDPDKWIDAESFVKRGEELMPILKANNRKLHDEVSNLRGELGETKKLLGAAAESIEALKEFNTKATLKVAKEETGKLKDALKEARSEGDVDKELEIADQLKEHQAAIKAAETPAPKPTAPSEDPAFKEWAKENEWFGKDKRKSSIAIAIGNELKADPETKDLTGRAFLDKVTEEVEKTLGGTKPNGAGKVEGGGRSSGGSSGGSKTFSELPPDAKAACDKLGVRLVGPGRAYATAADWRKQYTAKYFEGESA